MNKDNKIEFEVKSLDKVVTTTKMKLFEAIDILMHIEGTIDQVEYKLIGDEYVEVYRTQIANSIRGRIKE